jgi:hypothetical protein
MTARARRPLFLLGGIFIATLLSCRTIDWTLEEAKIPCGVYRWRIKTFSDEEADAVRLRPIDSSVRELTKFSRPAGFDRRQRNANEFYVYRVTALLVAVHTRLDQDVHLLLRDPKALDVAMVAEIPSPLCAKRSRYVSNFAEARRAAEAIRARGTETLVEVVGVGFFDELHEAIGSAPNGIELHPVLRLTEVPAGAGAGAGASSAR